MAEVLEFRVPSGPGRTLLVLGLETDATEHALYLAFSAFGPLYSVRLHRNAAVAGPGYYALVKYYSARDARRAQLACDRQPLFQKSALKVCLCTRQRSFLQQNLALNSSKCQELANHYLGFNGWSSRIVTHQKVPRDYWEGSCDWMDGGRWSITSLSLCRCYPSQREQLQDISGFEGEENDEEDARGSTGSQRCKYLCVRELTIPQHGICARGLGVAEVPVDPGQGFLTAMRSAQKLAVLKALSEAFQKILLVVLENGKVAVEYVSSQEDLVDCLAEEELKGLLQVTDLPFLQLNPDGEEEILSDFSMEGD